MKMDANTLRSMAHDLSVEAGALEVMANALDTYRDATGFELMVHRIVPQPTTLPTVEPEAMGEAEPQHAAKLPMESAQRTAPVEKDVAAKKSEIACHLANMVMPDGWTLKLDREVLTLSSLGWKVADIGESCGKTSLFIQRRIFAMTGRDKPTSRPRYSADEISAAFVEIFGAEGAEPK